MKCLKLKPVVITNPLNEVSILLQREKNLIFYLVAAEIALT